MITDVRVQAINFSADDKLIEFAKSKVQKLEHFHDRIQKADVFLKLDGESSHIKDKLAEIRLIIPGDTLFSSSTSKTFEEAIDSASESLKKQLEKSKNK